MTKFIPDRIEEFINGLDYNALIWEVSYSSPNSTVTVGNVMHLRPGLFVHIDTVPTSVLTVDYDANTFTVLGDFTGASIATLPTPSFYHGTPLAANAKISHPDNIGNVPFVYLLEVLRESMGGQESRVIDAPVRLFFLDEANFADWDTDEHYSQAIRPMKNFADYFWWSVKQNQGKIKAGDRSEMIAHAKFGAVNQSGHFQSIFNKRLSGIELSADMSFTDCSPYKGLNPPQPTEANTPGEGLEMVLEGVLYG